MEYLFKLYEQMIEEKSKGTLFETQGKTKKKKMKEMILQCTDWLKEVKERVRLARVKVALAANSELIFFYWDLGKMMTGLSAQAQWGNNWIQNLSKDLREEFPDMEGFSKTNLYNIKRFYQFYEGDEFFHQLGGKIP